MLVLWVCQHANFACRFLSECLGRLSYLWRPDIGSAIVWDGSSANLDMSQISGPHPTCNGFSFSKWQYEANLRELLIRNAPRSRSRTHFSIFEKSCSTFGACQLANFVCSVLSEFSAVLINL